MYKKVSAFLASFLLSIGALFVIAPLAHAATITWSGASGVDNKWSTATNWVGGVAPVSGDSIVIDNSATFTASASSDDIAGLSLASITFTNNGSGIITIVLAQNLTITSAITQAASDTTTTNVIANNGTVKTLTIGGNVTVSTTKGIGIGDVGDTLALGSNTLTFTDNGVTANIVSVDSNITGTGGLVFNGPVTSYQLRGANTYSGPTHVIATSLPIDNPSNNNAFGTSTITVETAGSVDFSFAANTTVNNPIIVSGTTSGSPVTSLSFNSSGTNTVLTVPNITLNGSTRFANESSTNLTINLAGVTANGHCVEYVGSGAAADGPGNGFTNGPAGCVVSAAPGASTPKTPNTGFQLVESHPLITLLITTLLAAGIALVGRRYSKSLTR